MNIEEVLDGYFRDLLQHLNDEFLPRLKAIESDVAKIREEQRSQHQPAISPFGYIPPFPNMWR